MAPRELWENRQYPIREDMRVQRITWRAERIGWILLALCVLLILLGATTAGPLSTATASDAGGVLRAQYQRIQRDGARTHMSITLRPKAPGEQHVVLNAAFMRAIGIDTVSPEPLRWQGRGDGAALVFDSADGQPFSVHLSLRPHALGLVRGAIGAEDVAPLPLTIFILP